MFRVSQSKYEPGLVLQGSSREGICYITDGSCRFVINDDITVFAESGEYFNFPRGQYWLYSDERVGVECVMVWDLKNVMVK